MKQQTETKAKYCYPVLVMDMGDSWCAPVSGSCSDERREPRGDEKCMVEVLDDSWKSGVVKWKKR